MLHMVVLHAATLQWTPCGVVQMVVNHLWLIWWGHAMKKYAASINYLFLLYTPQCSVYALYALRSVYKIDHSALYRCKRARKRSKTTVCMKSQWRATILTGNSREVIMYVGLCNENDNLYNNASCTKAKVMQSAWGRSYDPKVIAFICE